MFHKFAAVLALLSLASLLSLLAIAQESKPTDKPAAKPADPPTAAKKADEPQPVVVMRSQLPKGWKSLNLSEKQKKAIYSTRAHFAAKRQSLLDQLEKLKDEEMEALNKLLTEDQRRQLANTKK